jgi:hypothetical protein
MSPQQILNDQNVETVASSIVGQLTARVSAPLQLHFKGRDTGNPDCEPATLPDPTHRLETATLLKPSAAR